MYVDQCSTPMQRFVFIASTITLKHARQNLSLWNVIKSNVDYMGKFVTEKPISRCLSSFRKYLHTGNTGESSYVVMLH